MECIDCVYYRRYGACMEYNLRGVCSSFKKRSDNDELHNMGTARKTGKEKIKTQTTGGADNIE